nr:MAG TPA: hypothetical protein [Caudoviricetes sp.]
MINHNNNENKRLVPAGIIQATYFKTFKYILPVYLVLLKYSHVSDDGDAGYTVYVSAEKIFDELEGLPVSFTDIQLLLSIFETDVVRVEYSPYSMFATKDVFGNTFMLFEFEPRRSLTHDDQDVWVPMDEIDQRIQAVKELVQVDPCLAAESMYKEL